MDRRKIMDEKKEIVLFETTDKRICLPVSIENDTVWLSANQMALLFERDEKTIRKHINNVFADEELEKENNTQKLRVDGVKQPVPFYTLDVIISVGYRIKSKRGVEFRKWANSVLKDYIIKGYAVNHNRMNQLNEVIRVMKRVENSLDTKQVLTVVEKYSQALELLDAYDHQNMARPKGSRKIIHLKVALAQFTKVLAGRIYILPWKKRLRIYFILLQKTIVFQTGING